MLNNNVNNLEWSTKRDAQIYQADIPDNSLIKKIRQLYSNCGYNYKDLVKLYNIPYNTIVGYCLNYLRPDPNYKPVKYGCRPSALKNTVPQYTQEEIKRLKLI